MNIYWNALINNHALVVVRPYDNMPKNYVRIGVIAPNEHPAGSAHLIVHPIALLMPE